MISKELPSQDLPEYDDNLLLVRLNADVKPAALALAANLLAVATEAVPQALTSVSPALSWLSKSGMIRRVTPLARRKTTGITDSASALAASFTNGAGIG